MDPYEPPKPDKRAKRGRVVSDAVLRVLERSRLPMRLTAITSVLIGIALVLFSIAMGRSDCSSCGSCSRSSASHRA